MRVALLSIKDLTGYVADDTLLIKPLRELGHTAEFVPWQTKVDWGEYDGVVIRTTWDYQNSLREFLRVLRQIEAKTRLANSLSIVKWNADKKTYLRDLQRRGARIIPSIWHHDEMRRDEVNSWFVTFETKELVIKPSVGANAENALRVKRGRIDLSTLKRVFDNRSCVVQPFMSAIVEEGEFSLFYFNGEYSHAILKTPKQKDFRVQEEHGGTIKSIRPSAKCRATGEKLLGLVSPTPLYGRVDLVRTYDNDFALVELELIEPSMYLRKSKQAPLRFATAINDWLAHRVAS